MTKQFFGKSNGQRITTWMIKYPHIKKNAQQYNTHYYPASKPLSNSMQHWFVNIVLAVVITLCILQLIQWGFYLDQGVAQCNGHGKCAVTVSYTHLTLPTNREV